MSKLLGYDSYGRMVTDADRFQLGLGAHDVSMALYVLSDVPRTFCPSAVRSCQWLLTQQTGGSESIPQFSACTVRFFFLLYFEFRLPKLMLLLHHAKADLPFTFVKKRMRSLQHHWERPVVFKCCCVVCLCMRIYVTATTRWFLLTTSEQTLIRGCFFLLFFQVLMTWVTKTMDEKSVNWQTMWVRTL